MQNSVRAWKKCRKPSKRSKEGKYLRFVPSEQLPILERSYDTLIRDPLRPRIAMVRIRLMDGTSLWVEALCSMLRVDERVGGYIINLKRLEVGVLKEA